MGLKNPYTFQANPALIVISGPSGVGKDAVIQNMKARGVPFHFVVTATDRPPRPGEAHGVDYFFYSTEAFEAMIENEELLEHAIVYGQHKGVPKQQVRDALASGKDVVMRLDVQGAMTIRRMAPDAVLVFLAPSSEEELEQRMLKRGGDTAEQVRQRLAAAREELDYLPMFDYLVFNRDCELDQAVDDVLAIIQAEHSRVDQREVAL